MARPSSHDGARSRGVLHPPEVDSPSDDLALVHRLRDGDEAAYTLIRGQIERVFAQVWARSRRRLGGVSGHQADLLQSLELFLVKDGYRVLGSYRGEARFSTWLFAVATRFLLREAAKLEKRAHQERGDPDLNAVDLRPDPEAHAVQNAERTRVRRVVDGLAEDDQLLVRLLFEQGLDATQAGRVLGLRPSAVRMRKQRLLRRLQTQLGGEHEF